MYWRGIDNDGTTNRFIWAIQDTIAGEGLSWNPALRLRDYRVGRITSRTDSVFSFTAYKDISGVGVRKNRQAFFVASIDDNGVIDPEPAAVEFVATIAQLPRIHFTNHIGGVKRPYHFTIPPRDTVGMYHPFAISYHGTTANGLVRGYQFFPHQQLDHHSRIGCVDGGPFRHVAHLRQHGGGSDPGRDLPVCGQDHR